MNLLIGCERRAHGIPNHTRFLVYGVAGEDRGCPRGQGGHRHGHQPRGRRRHRARTAPRGRHRHRLLAVRSSRRSPAPTRRSLAAAQRPDGLRPRRSTARSTRWSPRSSTPTGASTSWSTTPAAPCRRRNVEDVPELVPSIQGAPRADDDFERTALFHAFAIQMNLISPLWFAIRVYRQMRGQDGVGSIINISSGAGHRPARRRWCPTARRRPGSTTSPDHWPRSGGRSARVNAWRSARR